MRWWTGLGSTLVLAFGLAVGPVATAPAAAHGGQIDVELGTDGAGRVSAALSWAGDGHPVEESAVVVVRAVSDDGQEVGPVTLVSASEGVGWYHSEAVLLDEGHWTVTARVKEPRKAKVETEVDVVVPPAQPEATASGRPEAESSGPGATEVVADDTTGSAESGGPPGWTGWALGAFVVGVVIVVVLRRRAT